MSYAPQAALWIYSPGPAGPKGTEEAVAEGISGVAMGLATVAGTLAVVAEGDEVGMVVDRGVPVGGGVWLGNGLAVGGGLTVGCGVRVDEAVGVGAV